jgi:hypothetical protein
MRCEDAHSPNFLAVQQTENELMKATFILEAVITKRKPIQYPSLHFCARKPSPEKLAISTLERWYKKMKETN